MGLLDQFALAQEVVGHTSPFVECLWSYRDYCNKHVAGLSPRSKWWRKECTDWEADSKYGSVRAGRRDGTSAGGSERRVVPGWRRPSARRTHRPELTAERFVPHPFSARANGCIAPAMWADGCDRAAGVFGTSG